MKEIIKIFVVNVWSNTEHGLQPLANPRRAIPPSGRGPRTSSRPSPRVSPGLPMVGLADRHACMHLGLVVIPRVEDLPTVGKVQLLCP